MGAKRNYKDSLFRHIFNHKARLRNLYEALSGRKVNASDIHINTLRGTFFSDIKNDIKAGRGTPRLTPSGRDA